MQHLSQHIKYIKKLAFLTLMLFCALPAFAWSSKGHQIVAYIAKRHLTTEAANKVNYLLDGNTMMYVAPWLDAARNESQYAYTSTWHYINVDANETYETRYHDPAGDAVTAIIRSISTLEEDDASFTEKQLALKVLIHVVGDLHQPMHAGHKSDLGGNTIRVNYMGESTNLHSVWDWAMVESAHSGWGYYDWAVNIDKLAPSEANKVTAGTIDDWARQCVDTATSVYDYFASRKNITTSDVTYWTPTIERQFVNAGLRLAYLINTVLDPSSSNASISDIIADTWRKPHPVFNLSGQPTGLTTGDNPESNLPRGIYISNGKKFIVR